MNDVVLHVKYMYVTMYSNFVCKMPRFYLIHFRGKYVNNMQYYSSDSFDKKAKTSVNKLNHMNKYLTFRR